MNRISGITKYYLYTILTQLRFTRVVNVLFIVQFLHFNLIQFALFQSFFLFSQFIFEIPSGIIGDLIKKNRIVGIGLLILSVSPLLTYFSSFTHGYTLTFLIMVAFTLEGLGNALLSGADDALFYQTIRDEGNEERYAKVRGNSQLLSAIFLGIATFFGGVLYSINHGFPYYFQSLMFLLGLVVLFFVPIEKQSDVLKTTKLKSNVINILSVFKLMTNSGRVFFMFIFTTVVVSLVNALFSLLPQMVTQLGFSSTSNGTIFMLYSIVGGIVASQSFRLGNISLTRLVIIIEGILILSSLLQLTQIPFMLLLGLGFIYITVDILDPIVMTMLHTWVKDNSRATFISGLSFLISLATMVMTPLMALILNKFGIVVTGISTSVGIIFLSMAAFYLLHVKEKSNNNFIL